MLSNTVVMASQSMACFNSFPISQFMKAWDTGSNQIQREAIINHAIKVCMT